MADSSTPTTDELKKTEEGGSTKTVNVRTGLDEIANDGAFKRSNAVWRNMISREDGAKFPPEKDRYHLFVAFACPWAHRALIMRALKKLEDVISVTAVMPVWQKTMPDDPDDKHCGWVFGDPDGEPFVNTIGLGGPFPASYPECQPDPIYNCKTVRDLYVKAGDTDGKYTVPILWDKKLNTIVSNESSDIIKMLNSEFNEFAQNPDLDLNPTDLHEDMASVDEWIYSTINNGVYKSGFAQSQGAHDKAVAEITASLQRANNILSKQRYIAGDKFTLSDIRLFVTLLRFDEVYNVYFKINTCTVGTMPVLLNYCREIYQMDGVAKTVNMDQIKTHYYCSHPDYNRFSIIPKGPNFEAMLLDPHNRENVGTTAE